MIYVVAVVPTRSNPANPEDGGEMVPNGWSVEHLPSPTRDPKGCGRPGKFVEGSFVCDPDGLLTLSGAER